MRDGNAAVALVVVLDWACVAPDPAPGTEGEATAVREELVQGLLRQGVSESRIIGSDRDGVPIVSGLPVRGQPTLALIQQAASLLLPAGMRGWESVPGVIRNDGIQSFRLEIDVNGPVKSVTTDLVGPYMLPPASLDLRDDGLDGDRVAGDFVFTSGLFRYNPAVPLPDFYQFDERSPAGLFVASVGRVNIEELDGTLTRFLTTQPSVGVLRADLPATSMITMASDLAVSPHLINIGSEDRTAQRALRGAGGDLSELTSRMYQALPDAFDFLVLISTNKVELLPALTGSNFNAGIHYDVQVNYTGTGRNAFDSSAVFGSAGRLLSVNIVDVLDRGLIGCNVTHELLHQWSAYASTQLAAGGADFAHYSSRSSVGSLVGGFLWSDNGDGTFRRNCEEGRNGAHHASPLDRYMMGLIDGGAVAPLHLDLGVAPVCDLGNRIDTFSTVTIQDLQAIHGVRAPGPSAAKRDFAIGFVVESHRRLLTPTEMTFYETLADHYTRPLASREPDPHVGSNWPSITRFFGEGTTWHSVVPAPVSNHSPDCSAAVASVPAIVHQNRHRFVSEFVSGVHDQDGDPVAVRITSVTQDEPVSGRDDHDQYDRGCRCQRLDDRGGQQRRDDRCECSDATGVGTAAATVRAERDPRGNGRVYHLGFSATDGRGGSCTGTVAVCVPLRQGKVGGICIDGGPRFRSDVPCR